MYVCIVDPLRDITLVAECSLAELCIPGVHITLVHNGASYRDVAEMITFGKIGLEQTKVLAVLVGRSDVLNCTKKFNLQLDQLVEAVHRLDPAIIILLASPVPYLTDGPDVARKLFRTSNLLKAFCHGKPAVDYLRATQEFVLFDQLNPQYINSQGISIQGLAMIKRLTLAKINCGKLRQRYQQLAVVRDV